jgi:prepilin-type N-terminal cleavage/methylation domain-containing protein
MFQFLPIEHFRGAGHSSSIIPPSPVQFTPSISLHDRGFSLLELLTVVGIIAVLSLVTALSMRSTDGSALRSATNVLAGKIQLARTTAILNNQKVRLLIENSASEETGFRRMMLVKEAATPGEWEAAGRPMLLPRGIFIDVRGEAPHSTRGSSAERPPTQSFAGTDYYFYEFSSTGASLNAGARIVLAAGRHTPAGWERKNEEMIQGIFLRRLGEASLFEDADHLRASF